MVFFDDKDEDGQIMTELQTDDPQELEVRQRLWYYPFGMQMDGIVADTTEPHQDYRYNGKELDGVSQTYEYGFRYYDPSIGKFTGVDPLASDMPSWSPYNYVFNNPIKLVDPLGLAPALPPHDYFDSNGNYLGSDDKGDEIRIVNNYDKSKDLFSQSKIYSDNFLTPDAHTNILSFYADQNGLCDVGCAAMPGGLSNEMEVRQSNGEHASGWFWEDKVISVSLNSLGTWGEYEGKTNVQSLELNNIYSYQSILLHEADHYYGDFNALSSGGFRSRYSGDMGILRHMEIYRNQIQHAYFKMAPSSFQNITYGYMQAVGNGSTNPRIRADVISIIKSVVPSEHIQIK